MSRKITNEVINAFNSNTKFSKNNSSVTINNAGITIMKLHGNEIARKNWNGDNKLEISNAGWFSNTTKERLNALPGVSIWQKECIWYLNNEVWDGKWKKIC